MVSSSPRKRRMLALIGLLAALAIAASMYMYFPGKEAPVSGAVKGQLFSPPRFLDEESFLNTWSLIVLTADECAELCTAALIEIRQTRLSVESEMTRMQTFYLPASVTAIEPRLAGQYPDLIVVPPELSQSVRGVIGAYENGEIFLVDPQGNLMMRYPVKTSMAEIRADMSYLLGL